MNYNWHWRMLLETEPGGTGHVSRITCSSAWAGRSPPRSPPGSSRSSSASLVGTLRTTPRAGSVRAGQPLRRDLPQRPAHRADVPVVLRRAGAAAAARSATGSSRCRRRGAPTCRRCCASAIFTSVRVAEQVRAGIKSLPRGQRMAGTAMGLTRARRPIAT